MNEIFDDVEKKSTNHEKLPSMQRVKAGLWWSYAWMEYLLHCLKKRRTSDSLNEGLPIKMAREKFQRK